MDDKKIEKVDDKTVKVSTTSENIDISLLKQAFVDAEQALADFEVWVIAERAGRQQIVDDAKAILDKAATVGVASAVPVTEVIDEKKI